MMYDRIINVLTFQGPVFQNLVKFNTIVNLTTSSINESIIIYISVIDDDSITPPPPSPYITMTFKN